MYLPEISLSLLPLLHLMLIQLQLKLMETRHSTLMPTSELMLNKSVQAEALKSTSR